MPQEIWTVQRCLDWTRDYLTDKGDERPRLSAEWLLSSVTGMTRTQLYMSFDEPLSPEELASMHDAVVRRAKGEPLQYICGETTFRTIDVACEPGVLIPRPETELLVEEVLRFIDREVLVDGAVGSDGEAGFRSRSRVELPWNAEVEAARQAELAAAAAKAEEDASGLEDGADEVDAVREPASVPDFGASSGPESEAADGDGQETGEAAPSADDTAGRAESDGLETSGGHEVEPEPRVARVLEVGTGTGCIALSLAAERPGRVRCVATDIEPRAVSLALRNREALGIEADAVDIRRGNLVSPLDRETEWGTFDVLVSNPPYVPRAVMQTLPAEVADFEPSLALDGGEDGLDIFRRLVNAAPYMLRPGGLLACELFEGHMDQAADVCRAAGMRDVRIVDDLAHRPRIILAIVPGREA